MTQTETQNTRILEWLLCGLKITPAIAWDRIGCSKLSTRCGEIIREGFPIQKKMVKVKNRYGKTTSVMQYSL